VADLSQQQQDSMQTDQATHEAGQYDGLIAALNDTKASLGSILKAAPGINTIHTTLAVILILTECQSTIMMTTKLLPTVCYICQWSVPTSNPGMCLVLDEFLAFYLLCTVCTGQSYNSIYSLSKTPITAVWVQRRETLTLQPGINICAHD